MSANMLASKKYACVYEKTVERIFAEQSERHSRPKEAEKAAKTHLHAITGAFMSTDDIAAAKKTALAGDLLSASRFHASVRERFDYADELYSRVFSAVGNVTKVLDLACGLNPLYLAAKGIRGVTGMDIHMGCVNLINECAEAFDLDVKAFGGDLICDIPRDECDLALLMKLLPVLEKQRAGAACDVMRGLNARFLLITFPTRTLGGRRVGMEKHYAEWFEGIMPETHIVRDSFTLGSELVYIAERD